MPLKESDLHSGFTANQKKAIVEFVDKQIREAVDGINKLAKELQVEGIPNAVNAKDGLCQEILKGIAAEMGGITKAKQMLGSGQ
jgi:hypothetical protein